MTVSVQEACASVQFHLQFLMYAPVYNISILMSYAGCLSTHTDRKTHLVYKDCDDLKDMIGL